MTEFNLCDTGIDLYLEWSNLLDKKLKQEAKIAKEKYYAHRTQCEKCTKPKSEEVNYVNQ